MRKRQDILSDLISMHGDLSKLSQELSQYPWDIEKPILQIKSGDIQTILRLVADGVISTDSLIYWANLIECREDLDVEDDYLEKIIFELANPEINGEVTLYKVNAIIRELSDIRKIKENA